MSPDPGADEKGPHTHTLDSGPTSELSRVVPAVAPRAGCQQDLQDDEARPAVGSEHRDHVERLREAPLACRAHLVRHGDRTRERGSFRSSNNADYPNQRSLDDPERLDRRTREAWPEPHGFLEHDRF